MVFLKVVPRCKFLITNIPLQTIRRPCSKNKPGDKCYVPTPCDIVQKTDSKDDPKRHEKDVDEKEKLEKVCPEKEKLETERLGKEGLEKVEKVAGLGGKDGPPYVIEKTRPKRLLPGKVRMGFIPEEWFEFFYPRTGVTGPYIFFVSVGTYLVSKEKYVLEHEFYNMLSMGVLCALATRSVGPSLAKYADKEIDEYENTWMQQQLNEKRAWEEMIEDEQRLQISCEGQMTLLEAKRENVKLQLEAAYRERLVYVHGEVKNRLDYHVAVQFLGRRLMHRNLVEWVVKQVVAAYTTEKADADIEMCISELASIAKKEQKQ